jgi:hypothetical protein
LIVSKRQFVDFLMTSSTYYGNIRFAKIDLNLLFRYFWNNPFRISRKFLEEHGAVGNERYTYGETPLTSLNLIFLRAGVTNNDTVLELGCGRGRSCFWLHEWVGCKVIGIEQVSAFVDKANAVKDYFQVDGVTFLQGDYRTVDWGKPSVVYLYASNLSDKEIEALAVKLRTLPSGTKVISVSYPIPGMTVVRRFSAPFTWGDADVYIQL